MTDVALVDYGMGNLRSLSNALKAVGADLAVTSDPARVLEARRVVLPGVGAFGRCMAELRERSLLAPVERFLDSGRPLLGICVGFQVLFDESTEHGSHRGMGRVPGRIERFDEPDLIVPHMGWNSVAIRQPHPLLDGIESGAHFYFVHSYRPRLVPDSASLATSDYGSEFVCAVASDNLAGVQFHPEKSGPVGLRLLSNFLSWSPR